MEASRGKRNRVPFGVSSATNSAPSSGKSSGKSTPAAQMESTVEESGAAVYDTRAEIIHQGLKEVRMMITSGEVKISTVVEFWTKFQTQKFVLVNCAAQLDDILTQQGGVGLVRTMNHWAGELSNEASKESDDGSGDNNSKSETLPEKVADLCLKPGTKVPEVEWCAGLEALQALAKCLDDPCGNLEPPFIRNTSLGNAELCAALGQELLSIRDPADSELTDSVLARLVAVMSHYAGAQDGRGIEWVCGALQNPRYPLLAAHLDPPCVVVHPVPPALFAWVASLPRHGGNFHAALPVVGVPPPAGAPAGVPTIPNIITCASADDAQALALAIHTRVAAAPGPLTVMIMRFSTNRPFQFTY